jgi:protein required for attachment to host cells
VLGHKIDKLVVFAPPRTLGELRKHYHKLTTQALVKEYHKDLVGRPKAEIVAALREKD